MSTMFIARDGQTAAISNIIVFLNGTGATFEDQVALDDALSRLPKNYQQVIVLRFAHDLTVEDTSKVLGWSRAKVRTTQHRALKRLRESLDDDSSTVDLRRQEGESHGIQR